MNDLLTQREVAARLRCSVRKVRELIGARKLAAAVVGRRKVLVPATSVDRFLRSVTVGPA